ncbi:sporulation integral membrane protein YtvI [Paramaledivibacter caminithermalis]|jgi:sporulation integral membrane protein YtvI|uniref:Sporulation integral membrane protein YtvI n=1 Tax=Paramaledivibacter caminithermalis (strain DSM 15212 / CIP 107654 / DViRD3) TaxID=1121301 RepID=A0A1M6Q4M2_PARC5|nr:sporulation integral membrane protein YtvI [Paramaledivibacter caminithermalis]SHK15185.1 sporulation integral membrane protein YtvI [Paramaledivibacter caminithermalis DSM 15212]
MGNIIISKLMVLFILVLIYIIIAKSFILLLPFVFGWIISIIIEPMVCFLNKRLKIYRGISSFISIIAFVLIAGLIIFSLGGLLISELTKLSNKLPSLSFKANDFIPYINNKLEPFYINVSPNISKSIYDTLYNFINSLTKYIGVLASSTINFVTAIPNLVLFILFTLLSSFFISKDKEKIYNFIRAYIPDSIFKSKKLNILKEDLFSALLGYIKAQLILMTITFTESAIGLTLIGANYSILIALVVSFVDALPVLGSGSIYIPWIIFKLLQKDYNTAIFLLILYLTITIVRQTLEPKILSTQIGLYPLVTLISIYIGIKVFGFIGIILGPIIVISILALQKMGILPTFKGHTKNEK